MNVSTLSVRELLLSGTEDAFAELRRRGVLRSHASNPTGDVAEWIVAQQLGVVLAPPGQLGYDLVSPDGDRVQVKGRRIRGGGRAPAVFGTLVNLDGHEFDSIACVLFDVDWSIKEAWSVPHGAVPSIAHWSERRHCWRIPVRGSWRWHPAVGVLDLSQAEDAANRRLSGASERSLAPPPAVGRDPRHPCAMGHRARSRA